MLSELRRQLAGDVFQNLGLDGQQYHIGVCRCSAVVGVDLYPGMRCQCLALVRIRVGNPDIGRVITIGHQSADEAACHVSAADEGNALIFHCCLPGFLPVLKLYD